MRIIAGKHKGLNLYTFDSENVRPTADRVRESIFNKLQFIIQDTFVLDLFGGTGAMSLEFLSRGAKKIITVDNNKNSVELIRKNFTKAKESLNLIFSDYLNALHRLKSDKFDIIFLDPPYATDYGENALNLISQYNLLKKDGIIVYEHVVDKIFSIPNNLSIIDQKKYGTIMVTYLELK